MEDLAKEGHVVSKSGVALFFKKYAKEGSIGQKPGSGLTGKKTAALLKLVDSHMERDDDLSLEDLKTALQKEGISVSVSSLHRWRQELGWTTKGTKYCQMVKEANVEKRLDWARANVEEINLEKLVFTDETTVQLENHLRVTCYKKGRKPHYKPKPKHPIKLHVWAGISKRGRTGACIFEGRMNAPLFTQILQQTLILFIRKAYPDGCKLIQDNDPKHCSRLAREYYDEANVDWWKTPGELPDLNPIECLWHELKEFIRCRNKPKTKQELIDGVHQFWQTVDIAKCCRYIDHIKKVIPEVIKCNRQATGF